MTATQVLAASPFGVLKGDTYPSPSVRLTDDNTDPVDPDGWTVTLKRWNAAGVESEMVGTIADGVIEFAWLADDTIAAAEWDTMVNINDTTNIYSLSAPTLYVHDTSIMFCSVADVVAITGPGYSQYETLRAIEIAEDVVRAWVTTPVGSPVPDRVRQATAILAARVLTTDLSAGGEGGSIIEERIADYSVRYSEPQGAGALWQIDSVLSDLLRPWKPRLSSSNIAEDRAPTESDDDEGYYPA